MQDKVCPVVFRVIDQRWQILLFQHPTAGVQIVKGTPRIKESLLSASIRELWEESGLCVNIDQFTYLGDMDFFQVRQKWHFYYCIINEQRDQWSWQTIDDYGHVFDFFWHDLKDITVKIDQLAIDQRYLDAISYIKASIEH